MMDLPAAYEVNALNTAVTSDNKIHDDTVARQFGFRGALVPGVEVYAYMAHLPVARWGRAWLESGQMDCRFLEPVYDGEIARVTATEGNDELLLWVESNRERCAAGRASYRRIDGLRRLSTRCQRARRPSSGRRRAKFPSRLDARLALRL